MSHVVTIHTQVRDPVAVAAACRRLGLSEPVQGTARLYGGQTVEGLLVQLPGWEFPVAIDTATGAVRGDNYGGAWGEQRQLDTFLQAYAVEKARLEARKQGCTVSEQTLADGSIKLTIQEGADMARTIEVIVSPMGDATVQTKGYSGSACLQATKALEQALGAVSAQRKTAEFYQSQQSQQQEAQQ